jgi:putative membrane protein
MPTCETLEIRDRASRPAAAKPSGGFFEERVMKIRNGSLIAGTLLLAVAAPLWAVSLATTGPAQPLPDADTAPPVVESLVAGSSSLVPLMAMDAQAKPPMGVDAPAPDAVPVGKPDGKPIDDIQFVERATDRGRAEVNAARDAIPQLKDPQLKQVAEHLVSDHTNATERLSQIATAKGWPVPAPRTDDAPPSGTASSDFDAKWVADMIDGHERAAALYRAQAQGAEDDDLRKYARDTLPTIERHLAELRSLQK